MTKTFSRIAGAASLLVAGLMATTALAAGEGLAFSPLSLDIPALKGLSEGVKGVGGQKGYDVVILDPKYDAPTQADQLTQVITTGRVKAAWVISVNPGAMKGVIEAAQGAGAVLVLNGEPKDYGYDGMVPGVTFAKIDYALYGGTAGDLAGQCANANLGGKGKALIIESKEGTAGKAEIEGTMRDKLLSVSPGTEVVANFIASERAEALDKVAQTLQAHPDLNVVVASNDEGALGALGAFEAAGLAAPCIISSGGTDEVLKDIEAGKMYGASVLNFGADLMQTFDSVEAMLKDPTAPGKQNAVPVEAKTK